MPESPANVPACFQDFGLRHAAALTCRLQTRLVQTNEVQRASYLHPVSGLIEQEMGLPLS